MYRVLLCLSSGTDLYKSRLVLSLYPCVMKYSLSLPLSLSLTHTHTHTYTHTHTHIHEGSGGRDRDREYRQRQTDRQTEARTEYNCEDQRHYQKLDLRPAEFKREVVFRQFRSSSRSLSLSLSVCLQSLQSSFPFPACNNMSQHVCI